jgi:ABC transporter substrate binding protein
MNRRVFLLAVTRRLLAAPVAAEAQRPGKAYRVGHLEEGLLRPRTWEAFRERLHELGYVEGQTVTFEVRWADSRIDQLARLAAELVRLDVDVILTAGSEAALAAKKTTTKVPIVMATTEDPVGLGLVATLARPGGNVTGLTTVNRELSGKRLEMVREALPASPGSACCGSARTRSTCSRGARPTRRRRGCGCGSRPMAWTGRRISTGHSTRSLRTTLMRCSSRRARCSVLTVTRLLIWP